MSPQLLVHEKGQVGGRFLGGGGIQQVSGDKLLNPAPPQPASWQVDICTTGPDGGQENGGHGWKEPAIYQ